MICKDLLKILQINKTTLSYHLKILEQKGLITRMVIGKIHYFQLFK